MKNVEMFRDWRFNFLLYLRKETKIYARKILSRDAGVVLDTFQSEWKDELSEFDILDDKMWQRITARDQSFWHDPERENVGDIHSFDQLSDCLAELENKEAEINGKIEFYEEMLANLNLVKIEESIRNTISSNERKMRKIKELQKQIDQYLRDDQNSEEMDSLFEVTELEEKYRELLTKKTSQHKDSGITERSKPPEETLGRKNSGRFQSGPSVEGDLLQDVDLQDVSGACPTRRMKADQFCNQLDKLLRTQDERFLIEMQKMEKLKRDIPKWLDDIPQLISASSQSYEPVKKEISKLKGLQKSYEKHFEDLLDEADTEQHDRYWKTKLYADRLGLLQENSLMKEKAWMKASRELFAKNGNLSDEERSGKVCDFIAKWYPGSHWFVFVIQKNKSWIWKSNKGEKFAWKTEKMPVTGTEEPGETNLDLAIWGTFCPKHVLLKETEEEVISEILDEAQQAINEHVSLRQIEQKLKEYKIDWSLILISPIGKVAHTRVCAEPLYFENAHKFSIHLYV